MRVLGGGSLKCGIFLTLLQIDRSKKSQNFNPQESTLIFEKNQKYFLGYPNMCQRPPQESFGQKYFFSFQQSVSFYQEPHLRHSSLSLEIQALKQKANLIETLRR